MKNLEKFSSRALSKEEMRIVKGGSGYCNCQCYGSVGVWQGYYSNQQAANNAVWNWCSSGVGACQCNF